LLGVTSIKLWLQPARELAQEKSASRYWQNLLAKLGGEGVLRGLENVEKIVNY
jgi:hypothetical protein